MTDECAVAYPAIHDELVMIAEWAARLIIAEREKYTVDSYVIRAAVMQAAIEGGIIPPRIMDELEKHVRQQIGAPPKTAPIDCAHAQHQNPND